MCNCSFHVTKLVMFLNKIRIFAVINNDNVRFSDNIVFLRGKKNKSQHKLAGELILTRSRYVSYEYGAAEPPIEVLIRISKYFNISIDLLVTVDIRKFPLEEMVNLPGNKILLPVVVDPEGNNYIEIVPQKASMGYLKGFSDPEYIESLQKCIYLFLRMVNTELFWLMVILCLRLPINPLSLRVCRKIRRLKA